MSIHSTMLKKSANNKFFFSFAVDEVKTERELPPLMLSQDFRCKNFNFGNHYFNLHGGKSYFVGDIDHKVMLAYVCYGCNKVTDG